MFFIELPEPIEFEWDAGNKTKSFLKHRVANEESEQVLLNHNHITFEDPVHSKKGKRFVVIGFSLTGKMLTVIFTVRKRKKGVKKKGGQVLSFAILQNLC